MVIVFPERLRLRSSWASNAPISTRGSAGWYFTAFYWAEGLNTPSGSFSIIQKDQAHVSSKYGDYVDADENVVVANVEAGKDPKPPGTHFKGASMPYFMRIVGGVGMHAGYLPGYPASHGCIRMPEFMAENFFRSVSTGTPVTISH
jgi:lipoprotein-anchoring transpeptidase ErfK/SrfK